VYTFAPCPRIAGGNDSNRNPWGRAPGKERRSFCVSPWSENCVGCDHWLELPLDGTDPPSSGADPLYRELGRWKRWWKAEQLPRSGRPVVRRRPGCPLPVQPVWSGYEAAACWTICASGSRPARPVPGSSGGTGTGTVCGPPSLHASGAGGHVDPGMTTGGALARS
jgi:hypothetical protein